MGRLKTEDKREAILKATLLLINSNGFHAAPMSKIAIEAGVSAGTIYLYFSGKEDLVNTLYRELKARFSHQALKGYHPEAPVKKGFEVIWHNILNYKLSEPDEATFIELCDNTPMVTEASREAGLKTFQPLFDLWERGQHEGIIKPMSRSMLYAFTLFPMTYMTRIYIKSGKEFTNEAMDAAFAASWDAIKT